MRAVCECGKEEMPNWLDLTKRPTFCGVCGTFTHPIHCKKHPEVKGPSDPSESQQA